MTIFYTIHYSLFITSLFYSIPDHYYFRFIGNTLIYFVLKFMNRYSKTTNNFVGEDTTQKEVGGIKTKRTRKHPPHLPHLLITTILFKKFFSCSCHKTYPCFVVCCRGVFAKLERDSKHSLKLYNGFYEP